MIGASGYTLNDCEETSVRTEWYVDLRINNELLIKQSFYAGYGYDDVPTNSMWRNALIEYLPLLYDYQFTYFLNGNILTVTSLICTQQNIDEILTLNVGIQINISCNSK